MLHIFSLFALAAVQTYAQVAQYGQCGGEGWSGGSACVSGCSCQPQNQYYSQCLPSGGDGGAGGAALYAQCGGQGYSGPSSCAEGGKCDVINEWFSICNPVGGGGVPSVDVSAGIDIPDIPDVSVESKVGDTSEASETEETGSAASAASSPAASPVGESGGGDIQRPKSFKADIDTDEDADEADDADDAESEPSGKPTRVSAIGGGNGVAYAGVNIAGCDFGCSTDGSCTSGGSCPADGAAQMKHFREDGFNMFRLPVGWQFLVNNQLGGPIAGDIADTYFKLVSDCLDVGDDVRCIIDIHNYARWNGKIVGQGGPTNAQFANLWEQFAKKYAKEERIIFGVMNEPHDIEIGPWGETVQTVVNTIRNAGATSQVILLPGNQWTSAGGYPQSSGPTMSKITNPGGGIEGLLFDVHNYFDADNSGTTPNCVTDKIDDAFSVLASYLKETKRQAMLTEFGGGNNEECVKFIGNAMDYLNKNSDVFAGWTSWAAGGFADDYELAETPINGQNTLLVEKGLLPYFKGGAAKVKRGHPRQWLH